MEIGLRGELPVGGHAGADLPAAFAAGGRAADVGLRAFARPLRHPQRQRPFGLLAGRQGLSNGRILPQRRSLFAARWQDRHRERNAGAVSLHVDAAAPAGPQSPLVRLT